MEDELRESEEEKEKKKSKLSKKIIAISIGILAIIIIAFVLLNKGGSTGNVIGSSSEFMDEEDVVRIALSEIGSKAKFYSYNSNGVDIKFFAVEADGGYVKTAFDACDVCHKSKKGYRQKGEDMICNNCGNYYAINGLGTRNLRGGGCWPGYLPSTTEGDYLVINKEDLENGRSRFA